MHTGWYWFHGRQYSIVPTRNYRDIQSLVVLQAPACAWHLGTGDAVASPRAAAHLGGWCELGQQADSGMRTHTSVAHTLLVAFRAFLVPDPRWGFMCLWVLPPHPCPASLTPSALFLPFLPLDLALYRELAHSLVMSIGVLRNSSWKHCKCYSPEL